MNLGSRPWYPVFQPAFWTAPCWSAQDPVIDFLDKAEVENADYFGVGYREVGLGRSRSRYVNGFSQNWPVF